MSHKLKANLNEIKTHLKKRIVRTSSLDKKSLKLEYKEWIDDKFNCNDYCKYYDAGRYNYRDFWSSSTPKF